MIKAVFFDFDGVLSKNFNGSKTICAYLHRELPNVPLQSIIDCYKKHCGPLSLGGLFDDVWDDFCTCIGQKVDHDLRSRALRTVPKNDEMFDVVRSLRHGYTLGILTDNPVERMKLMDEDMRLSDLFDPIIVSGSVGAKKHDGTTTIFDAALKAAACKPEESIFIDNQQRNLVVASGMGMHTYLHDDAKNDIPALLSALARFRVSI